MYQFNVANETITWIKIHTIRRCLMGFVTIQFRVLDDAKKLPSFFVWFFRSSSVGKLTFFCC